jgi:hypothetical protein
MIRVPKPPRATHGWRAYWCPECRGYWQHLGHEVRNLCPLHGGATQHNIGKAI